jgi:hypothetical protein
MSINDPRQYIKDILTPISVTLNNGVTPAQVIVLYESGPESLRHLFNINQYDAVITIVRHDERESGPGKRIQDVPLRYNMEVPIHVIAIDKTGVTATKLLNKIRRQIIVLVEAAAQGPFLWASRGTITVQRSGETNQVMAGFDPLWQDDYTISLRPYTGDG